MISAASTPAAKPRPAAGRRAARACSPQAATKAASPSVALAPTPTRMPAWAHARRVGVASPPRAGPSIAATSAKSRSGSRRMIASVGQAWTQAGASYSRHRSHLVATSGNIGSRLSPRRSAAPIRAAPSCWAGGPSQVRGAIRMFSHGQAFAQLPQPVHSDSRMNTSPSRSRPIAPVGQSIMHTGFLQCWHEFGQQQLARAGPSRPTSRTFSPVTTLSPRRTRRATPCTCSQLHAQWPQRTHAS